MHNAKNPEIVFFNENIFGNLKLLLSFMQKS
jgi:hypothetical protein